MKTLRLIALAAVLLAPRIHAQAPPNDPVGSKLFAPEFIGANAETISLSESQQEKMRAIVERSKPHFVELGTKLKEAAEALGKAIEQSGADRAAIMPLFEKVQDCEREMKRAQLGMLIELRGILSEEQRTWLTQLKAQQAGQLRERGERAKAAAGKLREADKILSEVLSLIEPGGK